MFSSPINPDREEFSTTPANERTHEITEKFGLRSERARFAAHNDISVKPFAEQSLEEQLETNLSELPINVRHSNKLERCGIFTVKDFLSTEFRVLQDLKGFGPASFNEVAKALNESQFAGGKYRVPLWEERI